MKTPSNIVHSHTHMFSRLSHDKLKTVVFTFSLLLSLLFSQLYKNLEESNIPDISNVPSLLILYNSSPRSLPSPPSLSPLPLP